MKKQSPKIKQFGSLVTGLALETSDMDMAVTNLYLPDREKMIESLELFADKMRQWKMIEDLKDIPTATIPVIKATVDLNRLREEMPIEMNNDDKRDFGQTQADLDGQLAGNRAPLPQSISKLKIDITFDDSMEDADMIEEQAKTVATEQYDFNAANSGFTPPHYYLASQSLSPQQPPIYGMMNDPLNIEQKTHLGIASCNLIKHYVESYKCLKEVAIVLKLFLAHYNMNSSYFGKYPFIVSNQLRRYLELLNCPATSGIHEQVQSTDESDPHPFAPIDGIPGLLQLFFQRAVVWYRRH